MSVKKFSVDCDLNPSDEQTIPERVLRDCNLDYSFQLIVRIPKEFKMLSYASVTSDLHRAFFSGE
jgi:hypothetical protein